MRSTVTLGSLIRALISDKNSSALTPGNNRQSSVASLVEGITFTFGGEPTPAASVVNEIVLRWIAEVNLFVANGPPMFRFISSTTGFGLVFSGNSIARS